jgi:hypothetical protein
MILIQGFSIQDDKHKTTLVHKYANHGHYEYFKRLKNNKELKKLRKEINLLFGGESTQFTKFKKGKMIKKKVVRVKPINTIEPYQSNPIDVKNRINDLIEGYKEMLSKQQDN